MAQSTVKTSFASGEWAPKLRSRVDIQKYHSGAAALRNFYVDYSGGGASTRQGTRFLARAGKNNSAVRLVPFQPSPTVSYVLEFGDGYIRFFSNSAQIVTAPNTPYQINSPFAATDLFPNPTTGNPGIKFVQDVTSLIICHPSYQPQILTITSATNWTISAINFGATVTTPTISALITNLPSAPSNWNYAYTVTAVDINGQESPAATPATLTGFDYLGTIANAGTNTLSWGAVTGAVSYNVYKASPTFNVAIPAGAPYGFVGNTTALTFNDAFPGIGPDFSQTPPIGQNPFQGSGVLSYTVTANGAPYTAVPTVSVAAPPAGGYPAIAGASLGVTTGPALAGGQIATAGNNPQGSILIFPNGVNYLITSASFISASNGRWVWHVDAATFQFAGSITGAGTTTPTNPVNATSCSVIGFIDFNSSPPSVTLTWGVTSVFVIQSGAGFTSVPAVTFSAGTATATANLGTLSGGNPGVPGFFQERLVLAAQAKAVQTFNMSQPASFFNYNTSDPIEADDAISASLISEQLNDIRSLVAVPSGLLAFTSGTPWVINGGGGGLTAYSPITPSDVTASPQAFNGANDLPPIKINFDILYVTNKGNYVRDLSYNIYASIFSGSDISTLSNHLFFNYYLIDWAWAEEPFKTVWATRNDGTLLSLGYVKEQDLVGWAHHDTDGQFMSVCSVVEVVGGNTVNAVYVVVQRLINGAIVQYIERMADRYFTYGHEDAWSVDCALQTAPQVTSPGSLTIANNSGQNVTIIGDSVTITDNANAPFTSTMASQGWVIRAGGGIYKITSLISSSQVKATVVRVPSLLNAYTLTAFNVTAGYTIWQPVTTVTGLSQLVGQSVVGVADGVAVGPLTVSVTGSVTLANAASKVTLGLAFTPQLQTLPLDLGEPTVQGKRKKITALTVRVADTLGLQAGTSFANAVTMKDFQLGAIPTTSNGAVTVTDLVNGDGRTIIDQVWQEAGNYCIQQNLPYPATVLGVFPEVAVGDTIK